MRLLCYYNAITQLMFIHVIIAKAAGHPYSTHFS